jgi:hypothetical protein
MLSVHGRKRKKERKKIGRQYFSVLLHSFSTFVLVIDKQCLAKASVE